MKWQLCEKVLIKSGTPKGMWKQYSINIFIDTIICLLSKYSLLTLSYVSFLKFCQEFKNIIFMSVQFILFGVAGV